jgi:hypothetical protein
VSLFPLFFNESIAAAASDRACCSYFSDVYRRFCFGDAAFSGRLNPKQFEIAFQVLAT